MPTDGHVATVGWSIGHRCAVVNGPTRADGFRRNGIGLPLE
ncbi:MAG TPA: hypothetical protein VMV72_04000 [Verrucomicrobiae bacterium]|nr:hypothetical protein [Verrucomicrobiae bacterium]